MTEGRGKRRRERRTPHRRVTLAAPVPATALAGSGAGAAAPPVAITELVSAYAPVPVVIDAIEDVTGFRHAAAASGNGREKFLVTDLTVAIGVDAREVRSHAIGPRIDRNGTGSLVSAHRPVVSLGLGRGLVVGGTGQARNHAATGQKGKRQGALQQKSHRQSLRTRPIRQQQPQ